MKQTLVTIDKLTFGYRQKAAVFRDFSLNLPTGQITGLLGKNGTGKSTLLYLISGLLRPQGGNITYRQTDTRKRSPQSLAGMYLVPEEFFLPNIRFKDFIQLNAPFYPQFSRKTLRSCLSDFDLTEDIHLQELSMGQKKKAFMSFALAANTPLLLMDEPTNGLDIPSKSQFRKVIASCMTDEKSIIISTHQVRDIDRMLDHIVMIDESRLLLDEPMERISEKLYFCEQGSNEPTDGAIYVQPSAYGNSVIYANTRQEESTVNVELLFNAMLAERQQLTPLFHS